MLMQLLLGLLFSSLVLYCHYLHSADATAFKLALSDDDALKLASLLPQHVKTTAEINNR